MPPFGSSPNSRVTAPDSWSLGRKDTARSSSRAIWFSSSNNEDVDGVDNGGGSYLAPSSASSLASSPPVDVPSRTAPSTALEDVRESHATKPGHPHQPYPSIARASESLSPRFRASLRRRENGHWLGGISAACEASMTAVPSGTSTTFRRRELRTVAALQRVERRRLGMGEK